MRKNKDKKIKIKNKKIKIIFSIFCLITIILLVFIVILLHKIEYKEDKNNKLIGVWNIDGYTKYQFEENGYGKLIIPMEEYEFKYNINDNNLFIDFIDEKSIDSNYTFELNNDELIITNIQDRTLTFKLKRLM